jgi:dienelactone hydrolase
LAAEALFEVASGAVRGVISLAVVLAAVVLAASAGARQDATRGSSPPPPVLNLVDQSREIRLPGGRRIPRPVTTDLWYPPRGTGPWPLLVFAHGFASTPSTYVRLLRSWAAAGYLVAAPVFPLGNAHAPGRPDESDIVNQPADLSFVITQLLQANAAGDNPLDGLIDPTKIAVAGQSDGAMTAFAAAYERRWQDPRIDAALILSGAELGGSRQPLARQMPPLLAVQGTRDRINDPLNTLLLFRAVHAPKSLLLLRGAGHLAPYTLPSAALEAVERVTIAFLDRYLEDAPAPELARAADGIPEASLTSDP